MSDATMNTASFYEGLEFGENKVVITAMLTSEFGKEIRIAFKADQIMREHKTKFPITVMTLRGNIEFSVAGQTAVLAAGDVIALDGDVLHELKATQDSVVRLSLHKSDTVERVKKVLEL